MDVTRHIDILSYIYAANSLYIYLDILKALLAGIWRSFSNNLYKNGADNPGKDKEYIFGVIC